MLRPVRIALLSTAALALAGCFGAPGYEGTAGPHFDGTRFYNTVPLDQSTDKFLAFAAGSVTQSTPWPKSVEVEQNVPPAGEADEITVTFINHATFLIQVGGLNILTDPVYSERASPVSFAGPKRVHRPGVSMSDLPHIDAVLISHNHYDHLDARTLVELAVRQPDSQPLYIAGLGNRALLENLGLENVIELDWNGRASLGDVIFHFTECRHRSGRGMTDHFKTLWGSFAIETRQGNIYFAGDTGYGPHFTEAAERFGSFELALLPIGAYEPRDFMAPVHLNPAEAVQAHLDLEANQSIGIHYGTFQLTWEGIDQPLLDLAAALDQTDLGETHFDTLKVGETRVFATDSY